MIKNATKNQFSLTPKTLIIVPTILKISFYTFSLAAYLIYTLKKKGFEAIIKAFRVLYLRELLLLNKSL